jgi:rRNA-processing protein FCF1
MIKAKQKICLDTNIIIDCLEKPGSDIGKNQLLKLISKKGFNAVLPAVCLSELVVGFPSFTDAQKVHAIMSREFMVLPFDNNCALQLHKVMCSPNSEGKKLKEQQKEQLGNGFSRQKMKVDAMILASAMANNCNMLLTSDVGLKAAADHVNFNCMHIIDFLQRYDPKDPQQNFPF